MNNPETEKMLEKARQETLPTLSYNTSVNVRYFGEGDTTNVTFTATLTQGEADQLRSEIETVFAKYKK